MDTLLVKSPLGDLTLFAEDGAIVALDFGQGADAPGKTGCAALNEAARALERYFRTGRETFAALKLAPSGTVFQKRVWREMQKIAPGKTKSYGDIARALKSSPRAVGGACGANPIPILIPCHRVLGADGALGGYSGGEGPDTKKALLRLEGARD